MTGNGIRVAAAVVVLLTASACGGNGRKAERPAQRHLVYVAGDSPQDGSVWISDVDGRHARKLTTGAAGVLSPDGRTVAVRARSGGIDLFSASGKRLRRLTARHLRPERWSPDGQTLYATAAIGPAVVKLLALDRDSGDARTIAGGSLYGFDFSPDGDRLVYSRAPVATDQGICGDQFDLYEADLDGGSVKRLTRDGLSAFPVWGATRIAFSHFPGLGDAADCTAPGIWTIDPDGGEAKPVVERAPPEFANITGFYGLQPLAWLDARHVLVGLRSEWGTQAAVLDTRTRHLRRFTDYAEVASSDGRFYAGSGGDTGVALTIRRISDGHRVLRRQNACCPSWNR